MPRGQQGSVLIVDDDLAVLESSSLLLEEHGFKVVSSSSADDAFLRFRENHIDAIVTDIVMPAVTGIELLRRVHEVNPSLPVVLMTAYADMEKVIGAIKTGAFDFIIKPFTAELLVHTVQKAVHFNRLIQMERDYKHLLEEYNREIETLVAERTMGLIALTLADKIRNPAAIIGLTCRRILDKEDVPDRVRTKITDIIEEVDKLDDIVTDYHSLLKDRASSFEYEDLNAVVANVLPVIERMVSNKGLTMMFRPSSGPVKVNVQKNLFQIALSHLLSNAAEATPDEGDIAISVHEGYETADLVISDTGLGISEEDIDRIFNPMYSTKDKKLGMGLPLVKRIVSEHMGSIDVRSEPGKGSVFTIRLPLRWSQKT